ncbi:thermonuclease family protein [Tsuneonella sp. CC-YZS046]|uniref:thermonuclease family protein n=1 Tax=Tsuneonella sp. CC-YZS046 TaxID=3042152 RepID=UPI002D7A000F|nr:thermonuclease family protein [Tsuneonella sp. CC-YZS046]WRO66602.1 thermonuclease family protein [Tsuneonella sp. CC-YZS046]
MADQWSEFEDAEPVASSAHQWAEFDDAPRTGKPRKSRKRAKGKDAPPPSMDTITNVHDGDTAQLASGNALRLFGVDAPELNQQGWNRDYMPVQIGESARNALMDYASPQSIIGAPVGRSYGRTVAPVETAGQDVGFAMLRTGNALAAPDFLAGEPARRADYMQAERLARLNRLGVHDTFHQSPEQHRANPDYQPSRETVAQFWDTPTPFAGLRPEVEKQLFGMIYDPNVSLEDAATYAKENGGILDMDSAKAARESFLKGNAAQGIQYKDQPRILTDLGDGATGAAVRGGGSGFLAGGLDEAGAIPDMFGLTPGRENVFNSDRRWADIWSNNQQQNSAILGYDEQAHPYATLGGQLAGGLLVPAGAGARTVPQLFRVGAAYGGAEGFLGTEGEIGQRAIGGAVGVPVGGVLGAGLGKALEVTAPYAGRLIDRLTSKAPRLTPEGSASDLADIPPPPPGFVLDESPGPSVGEIGMAADPMPSVSAPLRRPDYLDMGPVKAPRLGDPISEAQMRAIAENITPQDVMPIPSNMVDGIEEAAAKDAGRFAPARPVDERSELDRITVRGWNGGEVPKVGPTDMVGWLRQQGGLTDQGGELSHMGLNNAARRGLDFVGQETRFGPLVSDTGMTLDDAAMRAWEAGYFPDHAERPTTGEFLDALRDTYEGRNRRFLPEDLAQIDRFDATRADRLDLEQRLAEGPVFQDRSIAADEPQPFPPVQAYEEWPAGGPDFAGNINLSKLESPQDISRALYQTERRVGFDAATRGRVSQAETERLAADLGMTPEKLLSRRAGQAFNAEEALAARQLLAKSGNELVNAARRIRGMEDPGSQLLADFQQKWMRHVAIQEQVAGMTAEAGRVLAQFKMAANSRVVHGDVLAALVKKGGGKDNLQNVANVLLDAAETSAGVFNVLADKLKRPKWHSRASELYINFLLSGPQTHVVNMVSNTLTAMAQIPEHIAAAGIGRARQAFTNAQVNRITGGELGARTFGLVQGAREGARLFAQALRTGEASDFVAKVEGDEFKAIPGKIGEAIRLPTRFLTAEDELFKGIARRMEINGMAVRIAHREGLKGKAAQTRIAELVANPTDEMLERALDYGRYLTFQRPLGSFASKISGLTNDPSGWGLTAKLFLPFVRTPTNLLKFAAERSPAAPLLKEWKKDFMAGGARRDLAVARALIGTGFGIAIHEGALSGIITGSAPTDPKKARLLYADGWKPYSIKIGNTYYSYKRLDPFSTTLGVAADIALLPEGMSQRQQEDKATLLVASIMGNLASKTWLSGISQLVEAIGEPDRYADNLLQRLVGSFLVPNLVASTARSLDPTEREIETMGDALQARIPGLRDDLLPRRDIWGREIVYEGGVGPDFLSPVWVSEALKDPVNHELMQTEYAPSPLRRKVAGRELTPEEYDRYQEVSGNQAHAELTDLVKSSAWKAMDDEAKAKSAKDIVDRVRKDVRTALFGGKHSTTADEWSEFQDVPQQSRSSTPAAKDEWADFEDVQQRDVMGNLQRAIPGIRFTSGYRSREYNESLRAQGYHPARNSSHIDGAGLDMLPPPGKSLGWLRKQVQALEPNASFLIHDGHLHATFPDWYGAPVLGGARDAGLVNPMAR